MMYQVPIDMMTSTVSVVRATGSPSFHSALMPYGFSTFSTVGLPAWNGAGAGAAAAADAASGAAVAGTAAAVGAAGACAMALIGVINAEQTSERAATDASARLTE